MISRSAQTEHNSRSPAGWPSIVVDLLELIEVDEQKGRLTRPILRDPQGRARARSGFDPVGQVGQFVETGEVVDARFGVATLGNIASTSTTVPPSAIDWNRSAPQSARAGVAGLERRHQGGGSGTRPSRGTSARNSGTWNRRAPRRARARALPDSFAFSDRPAASGAQTSFSRSYFYPSQMKSF